MKHTVRAATQLDITAGIAVPSAQAFVLWAHGRPMTIEFMDYLNPVAEILRIRTFHWIPSLLPNMVSLVYQHDTSPFTHLAGKARFLKRLPPTATLIFANWVNGYNIENSKTELREKFSSSRIANAGPHDHLFHSADTAWDSWRLLRIFEGSNFYLRAIKALRASEGRELREYPASRLSMQQVPIESLRVSVLKGRSSSSLLKVIETPHYQFLLGHENRYREYLEANLGYGIRAYHSEKRFRELTFEETTMPISVRKTGSLYRVLDGAHRAALLAHRGEEKISAIIQ